MARKKFIRIVAIIMAVLMALSVLYVVVGSLSAKAVSQSEIDELKKQQQEIAIKKAEIQSKINSFEYDQATVLAKKSVLDDQISYTEEEIQNLTEQIATYDQMIADKGQEYIVMQQREEEQLEKFKTRLRVMEENGTISYISVILNANSYADLLSRIADVGEIMESDELLYEQLKQAKEDTLLAKQSLEETQQEQQAEKENLLSLQDELNVELADADALLQEIENNLETERDLYQQETDDYNAIQKEINQKVEELKKQNSVVGTGTLVWPAPSSYRVTSEFGMRMHPIYNELRMHTGIDIGASYGTNVIASDGGTVITSKYSSSYGNYIVISHGNGYTTLYAHLSSRLVKAGDNVTQGQLIGKVGSTGASTGPHLHYEVSVNGERVNPLQFFSGYTIVG